MMKRPILLSLIALFFSMIGSSAISFAATDSPTSFVVDLASRALAPNGDKAAAREDRFRQLFRHYFDVEACARSALGSYWLKATPQQRHEFIGLYEDYVAIGYSSALRAVGGEDFKVLGSQPKEEKVIVTSRIQISGAAPIRVDWQLNPSSHGYKVTDVIVNGISMAATQHSDLISVIQRNGGKLPALLVAMREKNATNSLLR
jgi:phospholipid transport system substrate-binding protein